MGCKGPCFRGAGVDGRARGGHGPHCNVRRRELDRTALPAVPGSAQRAEDNLAGSGGRDGGRYCLGRASGPTSHCRDEDGAGNYLASIPDGAAKADGIKLGEAIAAKVLEARANDGANAPDAYRPRTTAGVYVPTPITVGSTWPAMTPFALTKPSQFRPPPPIPLASPEWATDYNELKDYGGKTSAKRSAQQTETARFWLMVGAPAYHPIPRQLVVAKQMSIIDSARFMALFAVALSDSYIAVFDAKYQYEFWRPITAIRNGDIDGNPAIELEATWQPIDNTPLHPEYPCAHCINSGAAVAVIESVLGSADIPEVSMTSSTAPGVIHHWTNLGVFADEVANARIWAGFHYRFSTRVGTDMGRKIGEYVVKNVMQPR